MSCFFLTTSYSYISPTASLKSGLHQVLSLKLSYFMGRSLSSERYSRDTIAASALLRSQEVPSPIKALHLHMFMNE